MVRSLLVAALTFMSLGAYYQGARSSLLDRQDEEAHLELLRVARNTALFGLNRMKEALAEKWVDQRTAGGHDGATYRAVAVLRRHRGAVRSVGVVRREGTEATSYRIRADVFMRMRSTSSGMKARARPPSGPVPASDRIW